MNRKAIGLGALVAIGALVALGGGGGKAPAPPGFTPDPLKEADACDNVVFDKPLDHAGVEKGNVGDVEWYARVAFHEAYGAWPDGSAAQAARLQKLIQCVAAKLGEQPAPQPGPVIPPIPPPPAPGEPLLFDLEANWGGIPPTLRQELARIELASRIPGIARALGIKAWQAWRANQTIVTPAEAAVLAASNPDLCRNCFNPGDAGPSGSLLKKNTDPKPAGNGWQKPADYAGWAAGSYGLFDMLGATASHAGIHQGFTPLVNLASASAAMKRFDVVGFAASYFIWRCLYGELKVLVPGPNAAAGNAADTWANIFTVWAVGNAGFKDKSPAAEGARARYIARAKEIGINLTETAYPWPPGVSYTPEAWNVADVWARLQDFKSRPVVGS